MLTYLQRYYVVQAVSIASDFLWLQQRSTDQSAAIPIEDLAPRWLVKTQRGERLLSFRVDAWNQMRNDLITLTGEKVARQILYRIGMSMAKSANRLEQTRIK